MDDKDASDHGKGKCKFVPHTVLSGMVHDSRYDDHEPVAKKAPVIDINTRRDHTVAAGKKSRAA